MGRYDFVKDIKRIETIIDSTKSDCGDFKYTIVKI